MEPDFLRNSKILRSAISNEKTAVFNGQLANLNQSVAYNFKKKYLETNQKVTPREQTVFLDTCWVWTSENQDKASMLEYLEKKSKEFNPKKIKLLEILGQGGFGQVYKAYDQTRLKFLAIKDIKSTEDLDEKSLRGIINENKVLRAVRHLNTDDRFLKFYRIYRREVNKVPIYSLVMENGIADLKKMCLLRKSENNAYTEEELCYILYALCKQFAKLERNGISQRDVKPQNLILTEDEEGKYIYKIIDFGAGYVQENPQEKLIPNETLDALSRKYASPEVKAIHKNTTDAKFYNPYLADVYSLGKSFIEVLTPDTFTKTSQKLEYVKKNYNWLSNILVKMVNDSPSKRPQFSSVRNSLKKLKRSMPNEKKFVDLVTKSMMEEKNNIDQILTKINIFMDFNHEVAKQYSKVASEIFEKNDNIGPDKKMEICDQQAAFALINGDIKEALQWCYRLRDLEIKFKKKMGPDTLIKLIHFHIIEGEFHKGIDLYYGNQDIELPLDKKVEFLDAFCPLLMSINIDQAIQINEESETLKKKMKKNPNDETFLINYIYGALFNALTEKKDENKINKMKQMMKKVEEKGKNLLFFALASNYYLALFFDYILSEKNEAIVELIPEIEGKINTCEKIYGNNHLYSKLLKFVLVMITQGSNLQKETLDSFVDDLGEKVPFLKQQIQHPESYKEEFEKLGNKISQDIARHCFICEKIPNSSLVLPCKHSFCLPCLQMILPNTIENFNDILFYLQCPESNCRTPISEYHLKIILDSETYQKYSELRKFQDSETLVVCPGKNCLSRYVISKDDNFFYCELCKKTYCVECLGNMKNHQELSCKEYIEKFPLY